jgi:hypothetical protein
MGSYARPSTCADDPSSIESLSSVDCTLAFLYLIWFFRLDM